MYEFSISHAATSNLDIKHYVHDPSITHRLERQYIQSREVEHKLNKYLTDDDATLFALYKVCRVFLAIMITMLYIYIIT